MSCHHTGQIREEPHRWQGHSRLMDRVLLKVVQITEEPKLVNILPITDNNTFPILCKGADSGVQLLKLHSTGGQHTSWFNTGRRRYNDQYPHRHLQQDLENWRVAKTIDQISDYHSPQQRKLTTFSTLLYHQSDLLPKQGNPKNSVEQRKATGRKDNWWRASRVQSRLQFHRTDLQLEDSLQEVPLTGPEWHVCGL